MWQKLRNNEIKQYFNKQITTVLAS